MALASRLVQLPSLSLDTITDLLFKKDCDICTLPCHIACRDCATLLCSEHAADHLSHEHFPISELKPFESEKKTTMCDMIVNALTEMGGSRTSAQIAGYIAEKFPNEIKRRKNWKGAMVGILSSKKNLFTKKAMGTASNPYLWSLSSGKRSYDTEDSESDVIQSAKRGKRDPVDDV